MRLTLPIGGVILILLGSQASFSLPAPFLTQPQPKEKSSESQENNITFSCEENVEFPQIVVQKGNSETPWQFLRWLPQYFPNERQALKNCQSAAEKIQSKYDQYGGLERFHLTPAEINDTPVVCLVQKRQRCTEESVIFTLENAQDPETVLNAMLNKDLMPAIRGVFTLRTVPFRWLPF